VVCGGGTASSGTICGDTGQFELWGFGDTGTQIVTTDRLMTGSSYAAPKKVNGAFKLGPAHCTGPSCGASHTAAVASSTFAFAGILTDGSVVCWGKGAQCSTSARTCVHSSGLPYLEVHATEESFLTLIIITELLIIIRCTLRRRASSP
jgi:hypothetical protein